ncbi:hypothetical protein ACFOON_08875 [Novosphingobium piscinae]|uniref:Uncharacterized protein n=1 Tax=Novosphingobium piscinae TaxID=1507448 RepID=A0A7X1KPT8_9SPHN|nr:hypothetical protein [Novosphingobium piscinae]MBC2669072.1 hypothetical protein [Novosphingobium piscinae]
MKLVKTLVARLSPQKRKREIKRAHLRAIIGQSDLFDAAWYLEQYPDVAAAGQDPLDHFIAAGAAEGRHPGPAFDARWYCQKHADVARSGMNPLLHYLENGMHEGRSIRAVGAAAALDAVNKGQPVKSAPDRDDTRATVPPYATDYESVWCAAPVNWRRMVSEADQTRRTVEGLSEGHPVMSWRAASDGDQAAPHFVRAEVFRNAYGEAYGEGLSKLGTLQETRLGLALLADAWFADAATLILRFPPAGVRSSFVRAYQAADDGSLQICGEAAVRTGLPACLALRVYRPFAPVLVTCEGEGGVLRDSAVIVFPSLLRGGLHHAEWRAAQMADGHADLEAYMLELLGTVVADGPLLTDRIEVDLAGAVGSERLFQPALVDDLAAVFGVAVTAGAGTPGRPISQCTGKLTGRARAKGWSLRRSGGQCVSVPADSFPTLALLVAPREGHGVSTGRFCLAASLSGEPQSLVTMATLPAALTGLDHPALPISLPRPAIMSALGDQKRARPATIRFRDPRIWQVDPLFPLSPDVAHGLVLGDTLPDIQIIVRHDGDHHSLATCLLALTRQTYASAIEIVVIGGANDSLLRDIVGERAQLIGSLAELGWDDGDPAAAVRPGLVLVLSERVCLHDPRSLGALAAAAGGTGVASVSCVVMIRGDGHRMEAEGLAGYAPYAPEAFGGVTSEEAAQLLSLFPASAIPVGDNGPDLVLYSRETLERLWTSSGKPASFGAWGALGNRVEGMHVCLTLVRATALAPLSDGAALASVQPGEGLSDSPLTIRSFGR